MARGWENKAVESMMDDWDNRPKTRPPERSPAQAALDKKRYSLGLSRTNLMNELKTATHPRRRQQLAAALAHIEGQIAELPECAD
jgi:hypothetical protein